MLRLAAIAVASLGFFFVCKIVISRLVSSVDSAAVAALLLGVVGVPVVLRFFWKPASAAANCPNRAGLYPECLFVVTVSPDEVQVTHPKRATEALALAELREVQIVTNDSGPFGADVWWLLLGWNEGTGCSFPGGATGEKDVLAFVQALPGFNNELFIQAMGSTSNARFSCWSARANFHDELAS